MAKLPFSVSFDGFEQFRDLSRRLRQAGERDLRNNLNRNIRQAGNKAVQAARDAIMRQEFGSEEIGAGGSRRKGGTWKPNPHPSGRGGGGRAGRRAAAIERASTEKAKAAAARRDSGLRATLARNIKISVTARGIKIVVPENEQIPGWKFPGRDTDRQIGWRHPVFGDRKVWVTEHGGPWFASTLQNEAGEFRDAIQQAVDETLKDI